jgi:membrane carboxypeptidase/penicillin-binding protein
VDFMREALRGVPEKPRTAPEGIVEMKINANTGGTDNADLAPMFEYFRDDMRPTAEGYLGGESVGPQDIDPTSPDQPQTGADPIF